MDKEYQCRQIQKFIKGKYRKDIDAFCIYQWIERCHFHGCWDTGLSLGSYIPPNSLDSHYHKRLEYLLSECRRNATGVDKQYVPKIDSNIEVKRPLNKFPIFENSSNETLRQIYYVLYFMWKKDQDFSMAVQSCMKVLNVKDYQTVCDKCARRFAGTVDNFKRWFSQGEILHRLNTKFHLKPQDYRIFEELSAR
jgi:hypothetical protein